MSALQIHKHIQYMNTFMYCRQITGIKTSIVSLYCRLYMGFLNTLSSVIKLSLCNVSFASFLSAFLVQKRSKLSTNA